MPTSQLMFSAFGSLNNAAARFALAHTDTGTASSAENNAACPVGPGSFKSWRIALGSAPGSGKSFQFQLMVNGVASALDITIANLATSGTLTTDVAVSAADKIDIKITPSGTPTTSAVKSILEFLPTTANYYCYPANAGSTQVSGANVFAGLLANSSTAASEAPGAADSVVPFGGTLRRFEVVLDVAPGSGKSWDLVITKNGSEEATSVVNIADAAKAGSVSGLSIAVSQGDTLAFKVKAKNSTAASTRMGWAATIEPDIAGQFILPYRTGNGNTLTNNATQYHPMTSSLRQENTTESQLQTATYLSANLVLSNLTISLSVAPAAGKSYTFRDRIGAANGAIVVVIADAATTGSDNTHTDTITLGQLINMSVVPSGTPTAPDAMWSLVGRLVAPSAAIPQPAPGGAGRQLLSHWHGRR